MRALLVDGGTRDVPFVDTETRNLCGALDIQMDLRSVKAPTASRERFYANPFKLFHLKNICCKPEASPFVYFTGD